MYNRKNVLVLFFDVPMVEKGDRKNYKELHSYLINNGFAKLQKSVYIKLIGNGRNTDTEISNIEKSIHISGSVFLLRISLDTFLNMKSIGENNFNFALFSDDVVFI